MIFLPFRCCELGSSNSFRLIFNGVLIKRMCMSLSFFVIFCGRGLNGEDVTYEMVKLTGREHRNPQGGSEKPRMSPVGADTQVGRSTNIP